MIAAPRGATARAHAWWLSSVLVIAAAACDSSVAFAEPAKCDKCEDLCRLVDQYLQKEKGIELWRQYAASTPAAQRKALPANVTDTAGIENLVWNEFSNWAKNRQQNRELPCKLAAANPASPQPAVETDLETVTQNDSCEIVYNHKKLEGQTLKDFEDAVNCKVLSDAVIAHETVHQLHCHRAYSEDHAGAPKLLDTPENVAESELQAWTKHKEVVADAIRALAGRCGWQPTKRQRRNLDSVPSAAQTRAMQNQGWKAQKALGGTPGGKP